MEKMAIRDFPIGKVVFFVTGNIHKFNEARSVLSESGIATAMLKIKTTEIQDDSLENIAKMSALHAFRRSSLPVITEDAGLFVRGLKGFPGPYSSYAYRTIGYEGLLKLIGDLDDRYAQFQSVVVFRNSNRSSRSFHGISKGAIADKARGHCGFGFDPIFVPLGTGKTFAEMSIREKNLLSHRSRAMRRFARWYRTAVGQSF